jgi:hypothetical protein
MAEYSDYMDYIKLTAVFADEKETPLPVTGEEKSINGRRKYRRGS